jgi:aerobic carbon-monoxide dehydrogenase medium subunit
VAPMPVRARATENALVGGSATGEAVRQAGLELLAEVAPIDDARGTAAYRRMILPGLLERAVSICMSRAQNQEA